MATVLNAATGSKAKLIQATIDLISSKGYEGTGINEILEAAGVTKSNFYYHFKSKEELCLLALDTMAEIYFEQVVRPTMGNKAWPAQKRFKKFFQAALERMDRNHCYRGCPFVNLSMETSDFYPEFRDKMEQIFRRYTAFIKDCLADGVKNGEFRDDIDLDNMAQFFLSCFNGTMVLAKTRKSTDVIRKNAKVVFALILTQQSKKEQPKTASGKEK